MPFADTLRMASLRFLMPALLLAVACSSRNADSNPEPAAQGGASAVGPQGAASAHSDTQKKSATKSGAGGSADKSSPANEERANSTDDGVAGAEASVEPPPPPAPPESCELGGSCLTDCEDRSVTCGVQATGLFCEFEGLSGATVEVTCNQRAVIGLACCGGCGCVPVEVYFDGTYCWQGVPQCAGQGLENRMLVPHEPTTPNPSFTVPPDIPGSYSLGSGGFAGSAAQSDSAGYGGIGGGGYGGTGDLVQVAGSAGTAGYGGSGGDGAGVSGSGGAGGSSAGSADEGGRSGTPQQAYGAEQAIPTLP